jgi:hypothetical protein
MVAEADQAELVHLCWLKELGLVAGADQAQPVHLCRCTLVGSAPADSAVLVAGAELVQLIHLCWL